MKKVIKVLPMFVVAGVALSAAWAAGGARGGGGRGGGGRGNTGDTAPSSNPSAKSLSPATAQPAKPDEDGFIKRWAILEPIYGAGGATQNTVTAFTHQRFFNDQLTVIPRDGDKVTVNGNALAWHCLDSKNFNMNLVHFANDLGISSADALFWVVTIVDSPEEIKDARLAIGSNDASTWWFNGQEVIGIYGDRLSYPDDGVSPRVTLKKGPNVIRAAIHNQRGQTDFCARLLDQNDKPIKNVTINLNAPGAEHAGSSR